MATAGSASIHSVSSSSRTGAWEPLGSIIYGFVVHPLAPFKSTHGHSRMPLHHKDSQNGLQTLREEPESEGLDDLIVNPHQVALEVGDEVYAFEKFVPDAKAGAIWYRGYVVSSTQRPPTPLQSLEASSSLNAIPNPMSPYSGPAEDPEVSMGIFPASHVHVRDQLPDAEGRLAEVYSRTVTAQADVARNHTGMATLREEDESLSDPDQKSDSASSRPKSPRGPRARPLSFPHIHIDTAGPIPSTAETSALYSSAKPPPPRPSLKSGDETMSGVTQPLIDEIASALREWHSLMFKHLERRDYRLFEIVKEHIEALHLCRRQLLTQTLSAEETANLRRECVARLVRGNVAQELDVIVRHPTFGGLVTVDTDGEPDPRSWLSAIRMFAMQVSLAYIENDAAGATLLPKSSALSATDGSRRLSTSIIPPSPNHLPLSYPNKSFTGEPLKPSGSPSIVNGGVGPRQAAPFFHIYIEFRAFVASLCSPNETAELYFSLYNKNVQQFLTEEFCAILNHNGVLAGSSDGKGQPGHIRTLFRDLGERDAQDDIYLVCRIVRNGAMKLGSTSSSSGVNSQRRGSEPLMNHGNDSVDSTSLSNGRHSVSASRPTGTDAFPLMFRRPFGAAVLELGFLKAFSREESESTPATEHVLPIFVPTNEATYSTLHQDLIGSNTKDFEKSQRAQTIAVVAKAFHGEADTILRENPSLLQDVPVTSRLGFPDVVFPGDVRNEVYIKLWSGDFFFSPGGSGRIRSMASFSGNSVGPCNVQVSMEVRTRAGAVVDNVISQGTGESLVTRFHSMVFHRNNAPTYGELVKLQIPVSLMPQCHLFFTFRHRSSKEKSGTKVSGQDVLPSDKPFAFAYLPLFPDGRAFVQDGAHTLVLYRAEKSAWSSAEDYFNAPATLPAGRKVEGITIPPQLARTAVPIRDSLVIRSLLCSTQFTQNSVLLGLLRWDGLPDKRMELETVLSQFTFVGEVEIVKFLRDIFDSLFAILVSLANENGELDDLVFNALVIVLGIVQDRRFKNFQPVLDVYIEKHFTCAAASSRIIRSMNRLLANPTAVDTASPLRNAFKVWHYIFKFIVRARELQKLKEVGMGATSEHLETVFKRELVAHLTDVNKLMLTNTPSSIIGTQTIALQQFPSILPDLGQVFGHLELVSIVTSFVDALVTAKGRMAIWKLIMYLHLVRGFLFDKPESRAALVESIPGWIKPHLGRYDEYRHTHLDDLDTAKDNARIGWLENLRLSITIIAVMLDKLQQVLIDPDIVNDRKAHRLEEANVECVLSLLPRVLEAYHEFHMPANLKAMERVRSPATMPSTVPVSFPSSYPFSLISEGSVPSKAFINGVLHQTSNFYNCGLAEAAVVFIVMILASPRKDIITFLELTLDIEGRANLSRLLTSLFSVSTSILNNDAFPSRWLNINVLAHKVLLKLADAVAFIIKKEFIPKDLDNPDFEFDQGLWYDYLHMLLKLLSSDQLVIEEFSPQKRRAVWRLAGDIRGEGATLLLHCWDALGWPETSGEGGSAMRYGGYQIGLIDLVDRVLHLCLSHHDQLRTNAVQILYTMIVSDYHRTGDFVKIENELINKLDELFMAETKTDDVSRAFFIKQLRHLFDSAAVDDRLRTRVNEFLGSVDLFLELLLSVRELPEGDEYQDDRVIATLRLMNFIRRIGRDEIYIKYVHQLVNMHIRSHNYVEAALTLKLHSDLHEWDLMTFVDPLPDLDLPRQSSFVRKETLCLLILDYLGKGKAWESAIEICQELAAQHMEVTFNYQRLAEVLKHQAMLFERIVSEQRFYPDYFRVAFYGDFPAALRNKEFIYRGFEWEKYDAFCNRMLQKHSGAHLLHPTDEINDTIKFGSGQYIHCTAVVPEPDRTSPIFTNPDVPPSVRTYYEHSAVNTFSYSRSFTRGRPEDVAEFQDIWTEKTYMTTEEPFPTVLRRSEIIDFQHVEISPIESALLSVQEQTKELTLLDVKFTTLAKIDAVPSTNALTMALNEIVDFPSDIGLALYRQTFLTAGYLNRHPDEELYIRKLRDAIDELTRIVERCIKLHGELCPEEMLQFHETLERFFQKNFHDEIQRLPSEMRGTPNGSPNGYAHTRATRSPASTAQSSREVPRTINSSPSSRHGSRGAMAVSRGAPSLYASSHLSRPYSDASTIHAQPHTQTPLQKNLAHLARHGMNGMSLASDGGSPSPATPAPHHAKSSSSSDPALIVGNPTGAQNGYPVSTFSRGTSLAGAATSITERLSRFGSILRRERQGSHAH